MKEIPRLFDVAIRPSVDLRPSYAELGQCAVCSRPPEWAFPVAPFSFPSPPSEDAIARFAIYSDPHWPMCRVCRRYELRGHYDRLIDRYVWKSLVDDPELVPLAGELAIWVASAFAAARAAFTGPSVLMEDL